MAFKYRKHFKEQTPVRKLVNENSPFAGLSTWDRMTQVALHPDQYKRPGRSSMSKALRSRKSKNKDV